MALWPSLSVASIESIGTSATIENSLDLKVDQRLWILNSLNAAIKQKYTLLDFKKTKFGIEPDKIFDGCKTVEMQNPQIVTRPNLDFYDRTLKCLSVFQDFHLEPEEQTARPLLMTGVSLIEVQSVVVVGQIFPELIQASADLNPDVSLLKELTVGRRILTINGITPSDLVDQFSKYISAGSLKARNEKALSSITERSFLYPTSSYIEVRLAGLESPIFLKWWSVGANLREDSRNFLKTLGIRNIVSAGPDIQKNFRDFKRFKGLAAGQPLGNENLAEFKNGTGEVGMRLGFLTHGLQKNCYLQILTFKSKNWVMNGATYRSFEEPISSFLSQCSNLKLGLILDLRSNYGGDPDNVARLMSLFTDQNRQPNQMLFSGRLTRHFIEVLSHYRLGDLLEPRPSNDHPVELRYEILQTALAQNLQQLPFVPLKTAHLQSVHQRYSGPIVTLFSPQCASACELALDLLNSFKRSSFLGSQAQGTSSGFLEIGDFPKAEWRDDYWGSFKIRIPNSITVVSNRKVEPSELQLDFDQHLFLLRENNAFTANPKDYYETRVGDIQNHGQGWIQRSFESISHHTD